MLSQIPWRIVVLVLTGIAFLLGMFHDVLDGSSSHLALMSEEFAKQNLFFSPGEWSGGYWEQPPLPVWFTAFCFKIFGIGNFSFRIPLVLFGLLAIWATQKVTALYHGRNAGQNAALLLAVSQVMFIMNLDWTGDLFFLGLTMFTVWQFCLHLESRKWVPIFLAFLGLGLNVLAGGILGLVVPLAAVFGDRILRRDWLGFLNWRWLLGLPVAALVVLPYFLALQRYQGSDGLNYFFWQKGLLSITGITGVPAKGGPLFYLQVVGWAFIPWTLLLLAAFWRQFRDTLFSKLRLGPDPEAVALSGFFWVLVAFSFVQVKWSHHIYILAPFGAMLMAGWIQRLEVAVTRENRLRGWANFQFALAVTLLVAMAIGFHWMGNGTTPLSVVVWLLAMVLVFVTFQSIQSHAGRMLIPISIAFIAINGILNGAIFPQFMQWQTSGTVGRQIAAGIYPSDRFYTLGVESEALMFNAHEILPHLENRDSLAAALARHASFFVYTDSAGRAMAYALADSVAQRDSMGYFPVINPTFSFFNPKSRAKAAQPRWVLECMTLPKPVAVPVADTTVVDSMTIPAGLPNLISPLPQPIPPSPSDSAL